MTAPFQIADPRFFGKKSGKLSDDEAMSWTDQIWGPGQPPKDPTLQSFHQLWLVCVAYYMGISDFRAVDILRDVDPQMLAPLQTPYKVNHIFRFVQQSVAQLSKARPALEVLPETTDIDDQMAAKVGEKMLQHYDQALGMREMRQELGYWLATCGTVFTDARWERQAGEDRETFLNPFSKQALPGMELDDESRDMLRRIGAVDAERSGEIEASVLAPFQVVPPPQQTKLHEMPWVLIQRLVSVDWIWDRYPDKAKKIGADDLVTSEDAFYWQKISQLVNRAGLPITGDVASFDDNAVLIKDFWHVPSGRFPNGFFVRRTKTVVLENDVHPIQKALQQHGMDVRHTRWRDSRFPLKRIVFADVPGRFWGMGMVEHLLQMQREYDYQRHQMNRQRDRFGQPQYTAPRTSEISFGRFEYGDVLEYDASQGKPELMNPPAVPMAFVESASQTLRDMQTIAAQSEASQAQVPQGARSGVALESLQERDDLAISPAVASLETGLQGMSSQLLTLTWLFEKRDVLVRTYGQFRGADVSVFKASELRGNVHVRIQQGSLMPRSRGASMQTVLNMVQAGILNPANPQHNAIMLKVFDIGDVDSLFYALSQQRRRAEHENQMFSKPEIDQLTGEPVPWPDVQDFDDHPIHVEEHTKLLLSDEYEDWPFGRKQALLGHVLKHQQAIADLVQGQILMQSLSAGPQQGSPPADRGEASPPRDRQPTPGQKSQSMSA